jgi:hypothetical protein
MKLSRMICMLRKSNPVTIRTKRSLGWTWVVVACCLPLVAAHAQETNEESAISGFFISSTVGVDVTLDSRFGLDQNPTARLVNNSDCYRYLNLGDPIACSSTESGTTGDGTTSGDTTDGGTTDGDTTDGGTTDGDTTDGGTTDGETTDGETTDGETTDGETTDGGTTDGGTTDGETTSTDNPMPEGQVCEAGDEVYCDENNVEWLCDLDGGLVVEQDTDISCEDADRVCGEICGVSCGEDCAEGYECLDNQCFPSFGGKPAGGKADEGTGTPSFIIRVSMNSTTATSIAHDEFGVAVGTNCSTTDFPTEDTTSCTVVEGFAIAPRTSWSNIDVTIPMALLLDETCSDDADARVYFYVRDSSDVLYIHQELFDLDYEAPSAPTVTEVSPGETNVTVLWTSGSSSDNVEETYTIYYSVQPFDIFDIQAGDSNILSASDLNPANLEYQLTDLTNNTEYYVGVVAVDEAGNESEICSHDQLGTGTPLEVDDLFEYYKREGGQEEGGYALCFVATAAWNTPVAPAVTWLRRYRDRHMLTNEGGKALVALYYEVGPEAASIIRHSEPLRAVARVLLLPLVLLAMLFLGGPAWAPLAAALAAWLGSKTLRKRRQA